MTQVRRLKRFIGGFPRGACTLAIGVGALGFVGWLADVALFVPREPRMPACTAIMSLSAGIALCSRRREPIARRARWVSDAGALMICAISGLTLLEYALGVSLGINELLPHETGPWPTGRPSPQTALAFLVLGSGLLAADLSIRGRRPADYFALTAMAIATSALLGYLFRVPEMYGIFPYVGMSVPTALVVFALGCGMIALRVERSVIAVVLARDAGGVAARRLLGGLVLLPPVVVVLLGGALAQWYTRAFASALVLLVAVVEASALIVSTAKRLSRADLALRAAEARVRVLVDQASDAIFITDVDGRHTDVNDAACRMLGYTRAELLGKSVTELIPPEDAPRLAAARAQLVAGATQVAEWRLRRSDGTYLPVEVSGKIFADGRWQQIARDITERKRAEAALLKAAATEHRLRAELEIIIDQLPEGVIVVDDHGRMKAMNRAARSLAGLEAPGTDPWGGDPATFEIHDLQQRPVPFEDRPLVRALRDGERIRDRELLLRQAGGRMLPISISASPVRDDRQRVIGAAIVATDISERKELERLRQEWIAVVAHDLRQPISSIMLWSDNLASLASSDQQRSVIERVRRAGLRLNRMVQDLLDDARITSNQLEITPRETDVVELARAAIDSASLASPSAELRLTAPERELVWIDGDRILQVLGNLISNALKYGAPGAAIRTEIAARDGSVEVAVLNEGPDIPADELTRLFGRFSRAPQARAARVPGIGLGLYICKGLVEAHGGRIWAESARGTTAFRFTLRRPPE